MPDNWRRWRELGAGGALLALGLGGALATFGVTRWASLAPMLLGLALLWTGWQRLRFGAGGAGPGVVEVDERRLTYWGPLTGGAMDLADVARLDLDPTGGVSGRPAHWVLTDREGRTLAVPVTAGGADALLDLFAALPGLSAAALVAASRRRSGRRETLWRAGAPRLGGGPRRLP